MRTVLTPPLRYVVPGRVLASLLVANALAFIVRAVDEVAGAYLASVVVAAWTYFIIRVPAVEIEEKGVRIRNGFRTHRLRWDRIERFVEVSGALGGSAAAARTSKGRQVHIEASSTGLFARDRERIVRGWVGRLNAELERSRAERP